MKKRRKSFALHSITVLSVAGIFGGLGGVSAFAATPTTTPTHQVVTQEQSVSTAILTSDVEANFQAQLNQRVSSGKMTAAQEQDHHAV